MPIPDYLQYVQPLESIGKDDAWIAQALAGVTFANVKVIESTDSIAAAITYLQGL